MFKQVVRVSFRDANNKAGLEPLGIDERGADWTGPDSYIPHHDAQRFEQLEQSVAALGLAQAVRYANTVGIEAIGEYNRTLSSRRRQLLAGVGHLRLLDRGTAPRSLVTFDAPGYALAELTGPPGCAGRSLHHQPAQLRGAVLHRQGRGLGAAPFPALLQHPGQAGSRGGYSGQQQAVVVNVSQPPFSC